MTVEQYCRSRKTNLPQTDLRSMGMHPRVLAVRLLAVLICAALVSSNAFGRIAPNPENEPVHAIGTLVAQYGYDALGRLIVAYEATDLGTPAYQTVHFYYDGVRRIQEVVAGTGQNPDVTRAEYVYP